MTMRLMEMHNDEAPSLTAKQAGQEPLYSSSHACNTYDKAPFLMTNTEKHSQPVSRSAPTAIPEYELPPPPPEPAPHNYCGQLNSSLTTSSLHHLLPPLTPPTVARRSTRSPSVGCTPSLRPAHTAQSRSARSRHILT
jgi:hypothetical protein